MKTDKKQKVNWKRAFKNNGFMLGLMAKACPGLLVGTFISTSLNAVGQFMLSTYLYQYTLNALQEGKALSTILITLGGMITFCILNMLFQNVFGCYWELTRPRVEAYIQNLLQRKAAAVDLVCFENATFYDTYVKATDNIVNRAYKAMYTVSGVIFIVIYGVAVGTLIVSIDPVFLLLAFAPLLCTALVGKKQNRVQYEYSMRHTEAIRQRDYVRRTFYLNDFSKEMRLTEMWKVMYKRMHNSIAEMKRLVDQYGYTLMFFRYLFDFVFQVVVDSGSMILAAYKTLVANNMLLGDCFVVINSAANIASTINQIGNTFLRLDEDSLYIDNLRNFLDYEVQIAEDENAPCVSAFEELELRNMTFRYMGQTTPALSKVNLTIKAGEKIAIVGHNGAGKTTLIKLLQRLYDPDEGEILLNGETIKTYRLSSYSALFGTVFQDYHLFATTIAENVMLRGNITDEDREVVKKALQKTGIYDKVQTLSKGVDSVVTREFDREGAMFSGGEAQKISLARILAGKHEIVIMDEPTSALDPIAEQEMYQNMFEACEGKTVIFISHRLSSATMADRVYMFENGEIIEQGTHRELLALDGKYADMWHKQADTYADAEEVTA